MTDLQDLRGLHRPRLPLRRRRQILELACPCDRREMTGQHPQKVHLTHLDR